jgi:hypothetical protein
MVTSLRKLMSTSETNMPAPWQKKVPMLCQSRLRNLGLAICILDQKIDVKVFWRSLGGKEVFSTELFGFFDRSCPGLGGRALSRLLAGFAGDARSWDMDGKGSYVFGNVFMVFFVRISFFGNILTSLYLANNLV